MIHVSLSLGASKRRPLTDRSDRLTVRFVERGRSGSFCSHTGNRAICRIINRGRAFSQRINTADRPIEDVIQRGRDGSGRSHGANPASNRVIDNSCPRTGGCDRGFCEEDAVVTGRSSIVAADIRNRFYSKMTHRFDTFTNDETANGRLQI